MAEKPRAKREAAQLEDPSGCLCSSLRRTARAITLVYDDALAAHGLTLSQFCVLAKLEEAAPVTLQKLASLLGMDRTTLTRSLGPLDRDRLTRSVSGEDRRERRIELTAAGLNRLKAARPDWLKAQRQVTKGFGAERSAGLLGDLKAVRAVTGQD